MPQDTVFVFVGQAGCTIGFALASRVAKLGLAVMGPYVAQPGGPLRFIYCDAEHKVVCPSAAAYTGFTFYNHLLRQLFPPLA